MKRRAIAIALIVASTACSSTNKEVAIRPVNGEAGAALEGALARGDLLFSRGEHALAMDAYRRAMRKDPADPHALNGVAISYAAIGRHDLAREFFELALARAPQDERIHRNFARSLAAQGLRSEANALLAQIGGAAVVPMAKGRPTLAQLAAARAPAAVVAPAQFARSGLERVSMGEVRLRTTSTSAGGAGLPGRMMSQLSTAIVTVADAGGTAPIVSLARELKAPITRSVPQQVAAVVARQPLGRAAEVRLTTIPVLSGKAKATVAASLRGEAGCPATVRADGKDRRLPATGLSIDLSASRAEPKAAKCASLAGSEGRDRSFEQLWKWSGTLG